MKHDRVNTAIQIRKQKLQANRQTRETIGAIDGVPQLIVSLFTLAFVHFLVRMIRCRQIGFALDLDSFIFGCEYFLHCRIVNQIYRWSTIVRCGYRMRRSNLHVRSFTNNTRRSRTSFVIRSPKLRAKFCFLTPNATNLENILDATKVNHCCYVDEWEGTNDDLCSSDVRHDSLCDLFIKWHFYRRRLSSRSDQCSLSRAQSDLFGRVSSQRWFDLDNIVTFVDNEKSREISRKKVLCRRLRTDLMKLGSPLLPLRFANVKLTPLDTEQDGQRLLRKLTEQKLVQPTKRCLRPYLFAQSISYENSQVEEKYH